MTDPRVIDPRHSSGTAIRISRRTLLLAGAALLAGCDGDDPPRPPPPQPGPPPAGPLTLDFSFANGLAGWEANFADYTLGMEAAIDFRFGHERLPPPLDSVSGFFLSGNNASDDLFMYIFRLLDGLAPNTRYRVDTTIVFATNAPRDCVGVGGQPGESVLIKAGATGAAPAKVVEPGDYVTVNFAKGQQANDGADLKIVGNFAQIGDGDCLDPHYQRKTLSSGANGPVATSDAGGRLWLVIGTESGFESVTRIYWLQGTITLVPV